MDHILKIVRKVFIPLIIVAWLALGLLGCAILIATSAFDPENYDSLLKFISAFGSFMGGSAALVAAAAAFEGLRTWKRQIDYGNKIQRIWSALEKVRTVEKNYLSWINTWEKRIHPSNSGLTSQEYDNISKSTYLILSSSIEDLSSSFHDIDQFILRNEWELANSAVKLKNDIERLKSSVVYLIKSRNFNDREFSKISEQIYDIFTDLGSLNEKLFKLEEGVL